MRNFKFSLLDQFSPELYIPVILFYPINDPRLNISQTLNHLKRALSETLTRFYPFAGRIKDLVSIDCNDEGVVYVEAQASCHLSKFLANPDIQLINKLLPCNPNHKEENYSSLVALQVTVFSCGGIVIGCGMFHKVGDGTTMGVFLNSLAETFRRQDNQSSDTSTNIDFTPGSSLFPCQSLPTGLLSFFDKFYFVHQKINTRRFVFTAESLAALKSKSASESIPNPTRVEALTAFLWKRFMAASKQIRGKSITSLMTHAVDMRRRIDPPLPGDTPGNLIWLVTGFFDPPESTEVKLSELVEIVKETFGSLNNNAIRSLQGDEGFLLASSRLKEMEAVHANVELDTFRFTSWCNLGFYSVDFGWGKPIWVGHMGDIESEPAKSGVVFIESGGGGGGIEAWMMLDEKEMVVIENDTEFLAFASPNPNIILLPLPTETDD
ncbi:hypothetical protein RHGRI_007511 [Rhododendron griersonianum]|uniref:Uncharacterized protein n=1 Tax=Rhododendron griersonianum TaxID=479676 RepID=A0AAV6KYH7_9ERIC|nr:hypothetical protein RHGRI_007511 [Rhododendron griersonianum]